MTESPPPQDGDDHTDPQPGEHPHPAEGSASSGGSRSESTPLEDPRLTISLEADRAINLVQQQCGVPVIKRLALTNHHDALLSDVKVSVWLADEEVAEPFETTIDRIPSGATVTIPDVDVALRPEVLRQRTEREVTRIVASAEGVAREEIPDETSPFADPFLVRVVAPVTLLAWNEWGGVSGLTEVLASFVLPNDPFTAKLLDASRAPLRARVGNDAFDGYQARDPQRVVNLIGAIFEGAVSLGVGYLSTPASFESHGQKIRLPETIDRDRQGNCLDLTLLLAAACEQAGLHPLLVLVEGHVVLGVWLQEQSFPEAVVETASRVLNREANRELLLVESTMVTHAERASFDAAMAAGRQCLEEHRESMVAIDVHQARKLSFLPLSSRLDDRGGPPPSDSPASDSSVTTGPSALDLPEIIRPEDVPPGETPKTRVDRWKKKLLDLTLRNRLLAFRASKKTLEFLVPDLGRLESLLQNEKTFSVRTTPDVLQGVRDLQALRRNEGTDVDARPLAEAVEAGALCCPETREEIDRRLTAIFREARTVAEESGSNNLFLMLGQLRWYETDSSPTERRAPLILLPVQLTKAARGSFRLALSGEEPRPNITLLQKLRGDYSIDTTGLDEFPTDEAGVDVGKVLATFRDRIKDRERWEVLETVHLGILQFSKFVLWRDLDEHMESLETSPVVRLLLDAEGEGEGLDAQAPLPRPEEIDRTVAPGDLLCPLDADSSQLAAIRAASEGRTFVLQGPPGTGKSQTITNLIAHALAAGQRVLFVAEKSAALEVVQRRLEAQGLGEACLAIHSNKAGKREVLDQIKRTLDADHVEPPTAAFERTRQELEIRRDELNAYVSDLHEEHPCGLDFFRATGLLRQLGDGPVSAIEFADPLQAPPETLQAMRTAGRELAVSLREVAPLARHPFLGCSIDEWTRSASREIAALATQLAATAKTLEQARSAAARDGGFLPAASAGLLDGPDARSLEAEIDLARALLSCPGTSLSLLRAEEPSALRVRLNTLIGVAEEVATRAADLEVRWSATFFGLDSQAWSARIARAQGAFILVRWLQARGLRRELSSHLQAHHGPLTLETAYADFLQLTELREERRRLEQGQDLLLTHVATAHDQHGSLDPERARAQVTWAFEVLEKLHQLEGRHASSHSLAEAFIACATDREGARLRASETRERIEGFVKAHDAFEAARAALAAAVQMNEDEALGARHEPRWLERVAERAGTIATESDELRHWANWQVAVGSARQAGLSALVDDLSSGRIDADRTESVLERSLMERIAEAALVHAPRLQRFSRERHEDRIRQFRELDEDLLELNRRMASARSGERTPDISQGASGGEAAILARELGKQRRHLPLRQLFARTRTLLPRIKPCMLMSPLSVAQYLAPDWRADLVIFDEASQITVPDAIGALGRGKAAVIVGDSKQLPPTSFFAKVTDEDDEDDAIEGPEDLQSILEECAASGVPSMSLDWHYRSQHESLIAFSNEHYYDNRLHTFPSAAEAMEGLGVTHRYLPEAVYDQGRSATNRGEAEAILEELKRRTAHVREDGPVPSIGVVAFSKAQATLIEDLVDEATRSHPGLEITRRDEHEPLFIKNLENVQGDERDTILFSICYGPNAAGKTAMRFGPLNQQGGERRLNVAITRARRELVVFSRMRTEDIDLRRTNALGARHLKVFLDYAVRGPKAIAAATDLHPEADLDSPFERSVHDALRARGHEIDLQVGCSGYRIDLAVRHPDEPGRHVLGIACDGASYHSAATARDRDRLRQAVLEGLGWTIHRIWSTDYFADPAREIDRVEAAIVAALEAPAPIAPPPEDAFTAPDEPAHDDAREEGGPPPPGGTGESTDSSPTTDEDASSVAETAPAYTPWSGSAPRALIDDEDAEGITRVMTAIIEAEAPITTGYLHRRVIAACEVARLGTRIQAFLESRHPALEAAGFPLVDDVFWARGQDPSSWRGFRVAIDEGSKRRIQEIPQVELVNALEHELGLAFGIARDDLLRAAVKLLGFTSLGVNVRACIEKALERLVTEGRALRDANRDHVRLPD